MLLLKVLSRIKEKRVCFLQKRLIWTVDKIVKSPCRDIVIPEVTITEYTWRNLEKWSDKTALVCGITDRKYTYLQLYRQSEKFGGSLRKKFKIKDGDVVFVMLPNSPEYPIVILGILTAGGIVCTTNPMYTVYEAQKQILTSDAKLIVTDPATVPLVKEALKLNKLKLPIITIDIDKDRPEETVSFKELINDIHLDTTILKEVKRNAQDISLLLYSSGTTGLPKAVQLTHRNIVANCEQQSTDSMSKKFNDTTETNQDINLAYLPMFHSYGISIIVLHKLSVGLKLVTLPRFNPDTFFSTLEKHKMTGIPMAPPTVLFLSSSPQAKSKHFEKLQYVIVGGAPLPKADTERFLCKIDHEINFGQVYGLTETAPLATVCPNGFKEYTSVGYALANCKLRVVDDQMNNLGPNEVGELLIKGPNVMKGYKNNPTANSEVLVDGWFRSGDLAKIDERGCVTIVDRLKELIKVNAYQVPPAELESILRGHPAVSDAAVVGVPDNKTGEKPKAFVILKKNFAVNKTDIMEYISDRVAPYKRLQEVQFVDNIPKTPSGKILRRLLVKQ